MEDYEFYHTEEYTPDFNEATRAQAEDDYDLLNETGRYEPTIAELFDRIKENYPRKTDKWILDACKRYIAQSRKLHAIRKRELGIA